MSKQIKVMVGVVVLVKEKVRSKTFFFQKDLGSESKGQQIFEPKKFWTKENKFQKIVVTIKCAPKNFQEQNICSKNLFIQKKFGPILENKNL